MTEQLLAKEIAFHGKMSEMSGRIIIIVPKEYHGRIRKQGLLKKLMKFRAEEVMQE